MDHSGFNIYLLARPELATRKPELVGLVNIVSSLSSTGGFLWIKTYVEGWCIYIFKSRVYICEPDCGHSLLFDSSAVDVTSKHISKSKAKDGFRYSIRRKEHYIGPRRSAHRLVYAGLKPWHEPYRAKYSQDLLMKISAILNSALTSPEYGFHQSPHARRQLITSGEASLVLQYLIDLRWESSSW